MNHLLKIYADLYFISIGQFFRIAPGGNGTCDISVQLPKASPEDDADYDLFVRVLQCRSMTSKYSDLGGGVIRDISVIALK